MREMHDAVNFYACQSSNLKQLISRSSLNGSHILTFINVVNNNLILAIFGK